MTDNNVLKLSEPSTFSDPLTEVLRNGARSILAQAEPVNDFETVTIAIY